MNRNQYGIISNSGLYCHVVSRGNSTLSQASIYVSHSILKKIPDVFCKAHARCRTSVQSSLCVYPRQTEGAPWPQRLNINSREEFRATFQKWELKCHKYRAESDQCPLIWVCCSPNFLSGPFLFLLFVLSFSRLFLLRICWIAGRLWRIEKVEERSCRGVF